MRVLIAATVGFTIGWLTAPHAAELSACRGVEATASQPLHEVAHAAHTGGCKVHMSPTGYPLPDPDCTPGAVNPTLTADVLRRKGFTTKCVRDAATSAHAKASTYAAYGIAHPKKNTGKTQTCELDHLCSLELGCADTLDNIWPQCGPAGVPLAKRWFKIKDAVENYLAREVKAGRMTLQEAQDGVTSDWSQFVPAATAKRGKR